MEFVVRISSTNFGNLFPVQIIDIIEFKDNQFAGTSEHMIGMQFHHTNL